MKDDRIGNKKLLVARSDKGCGETYRRVWFVSKNEE